MFWDVFKTAKLDNLKPRQLAEVGAGGGVGVRGATGMEVGAGMGASGGSGSEG